MVVFVLLLPAVMHPLWSFLAFVVVVAITLLVVVVVVAVTPRQV